MRLTDELYQKYLEELQDFESFKLSHTEGYFGVLKEVMEDPHTKHIVETLAFFIARCQLQGEQTLLNLYQRLFRQYFPYLWSPLPSMGLIQFTPSKNLGEPVPCREGTEVTLQTKEGRRVYFQTSQSVQVLPIHQSDTHFEVQKEGKTRLFLKFKSIVNQREEIGTFRLFTNCLNSFPSSWSLNIALRQHLNNVQISYENPPFEEFKGAPCEVSFTTAEQSTVFSHPIEKLRSLIHFPEQELFLDIKVPRHGKKWNSFTLCFDLGLNWPETFPLSNESFHPFVVPIVNTQKQTAEFIRFDGTQDNYPLLHPAPEKGFAIHSILGVYSIKNHKLSPLKPEFLSQGDSCYEIEPTFTDDNPPDYKLSLEVKEALKSPVLISVEANWYQPWFDKLEYDVNALLLNQMIKEMKIGFIGELTSPEDRTATYKTKLLTRLLSLKNQTLLGLEDLLFLLNILKLNTKTYFKELPNYIKDLKIRQRCGSMNTGITHEYGFLLEKMDDKNQNLVLLYFRYIKKFLDLWLPNIDVEVVINAPNFKEPITIKEGSSNEISTMVRDILLF